MSLVASSAAVANVVENPDYIPRPRNAFIIFRADRSKKYQGRTAGDISQLVAAEWKTLSADMKARYEQQADEEKQRHKLRFPHYRFQPKQKPKVKDKEERKKIESKVAEKLEERRAQKRAARAKAKKRKEMAMAMQMTAPIPLPVPLGYPSQLDSTAHLPFIPVLIPNPAYLARIPPGTISTHFDIDSAIPPLVPPSPPSPCVPRLESGPVTPVVAGSPVRPPLEVNTMGKKEDREATAASPIIASTSPFQHTATVSPSPLEWPAVFDHLPISGFETLAPDAWFSYSMSPLSSAEICRSFYSNSFGSTSSLQLSEASDDPGNWLVLIDEIFGNPRTDGAFGVWDPGSFDLIATSASATAAASSINSTLNNLPSTAAPALATARHSIGKQVSPGLDAGDTTFDARLSDVPEWGNCLGLEYSDGQELRF